MASLKDIKRHIVAVKQTQKLTKAMNMVAAAKLRANQNRTERFRFYAEEHARLVTEIGHRAPDIDSPLLSELPAAPKSLIVAFTSDRGLCGSYNTNVISQVYKAIESQQGEGLQPELYVLGRKGFDYFNRFRTVNILFSRVGETGLVDYEMAREITGYLIDLYKSGQHREINLCYTAFKTLTRHVVTFDRLLPLVEDEHHKSQKSIIPHSSEQVYLIEPKPSDLLNRLIPRSLTIKVYRALLESVTSENAARMQAMDNASKSCKDIISSLTMAYNKARQAAVTNELLDIVNGAEALKG
ncbi:MAG: ATP synthase F1 subunit gamma [Deltaproteobacteria bacterium]|jgi:F-type H+-transporting ATPase subunit gamma|nr:ATP synthase F1 subunit gamma [Deltaproteobacteria bacterium]